MMTSLEASKVAQRRHKDVLRAIRAMEPAWEKVNGRKFSLVEYKDQKGESRPCYSLTKDEWLYVATKFNDEARARLVVRWKELEEENTPQVPKTFREALLLAADQQERIERLEMANKEKSLEIAKKEEVIEAQTQQIEYVKERLSYFDMILNDTSLMSVTSIAKDYGIGAVTLNQWLNELGVQYKQGDKWLLYYQYQSQGYVSTKMIPICDRNGCVIRYKSHTEWTQKGRLFIYNLLKTKRNILPLIER